MRHITALLLGLLLIVGSVFSGSGHVHATLQNPDSSGLHVDHVHVDPAGHHHGPSHEDPHSALEAADHPGDDAITLTWASFEAKTKRALPCLAAAAPGDPPDDSPAERSDPAEAPPRHPQSHTRPPGRAPPA